MKKIYCWSISIVLLASLITFLSSMALYSKNFDVLSVMADLDGRVNYVTKDLNNITSEIFYPTDNRYIEQGAKDYNGSLPKVNLFKTHKDIYVKCMQNNTLMKFIYQKNNEEEAMKGTVIGIYRCKLDNYIGELKIEMYVKPSSYLKKYDGEYSVALFYKDLDIPIGKATITGGNI